MYLAPTLKKASRLSASSNGGAMITDQVRAYIQSAPELRRVNQGVVAEHLGMGQSTLNRALRNEGVSYLQLLDDERKARAEALLSRNRHADVPAICRVTGYSAASISRAVKRWFGMSLPDCRGML